MVTLAKALGGGLPTGAIGGTEEVMAVVEDGSVYQVGTYNGNPLGMAAARANLLEVLTPEAYAHLDRLNDRILAGCERGHPRSTTCPGYAVGIGSKGCVTFSPTKIVDYETFKANQDADLVRARLAVQHEPRHLHDAGPRGGVDAVGDAHRRGGRPLRRGLRGDGRRAHAVVAPAVPGAARRTGLTEQAPWRRRPRGWDRGGHDPHRPHQPSPPRRPSRCRASSAAC